MQTEQSEKIFFSYLLKNGEYLSYILERFFDQEEYQLLLPKLKDFFTRYKQTPSKKQMWEIVLLDNFLSDRISQEKIDMIWSWDISSYDEQWLKETFEAWIEFKNLEISIFDVVSYVKNEKINQDNIKDVVNKVKQMTVDRNSLDFSFDVGTNFADPDKHEEGENARIPTGIHYIDTATKGGPKRKGLYLLLAPMKVGKCSTGDTMIKIRNKKTKEIQEISLLEFFTLLS